MQFTRFIRNPAVSVAEMAAHVAARTGPRAVGRDIVAIQDTSELTLGSRRARERGFGPVGRGCGLGGLLVHPVLAADAVTGELVGLVDLKVWNRDSGTVTGPNRSRVTAQKESQRWLDGVSRASEVLATAARITMVSDAESDMYEEFVVRPANVELIVRAAQNRCIATEPNDDRSTLLFAFADALPEQGRLTVTIPAAPGRKARTTELSLRFSPVTLCKPLHGAARELAKTVTLVLLDVRETAKPKDGEGIHWRLLTTHAITNLQQARWVLDLYRRRWLIEEYFRTLKTAGFDIENAEIADPRAMSNFVAAAAIAGVTVMQLVQARDGATRQALTDVFDPADQPLLEAASANLEGKTARQKNPHPKGSLAFAAWVIGRLGGWDGYYGKPGPQVMRRGIHDFQRIKYGATLGGRNV